MTRTTQHSLRAAVMVAALALPGAASAQQQPAGEAATPAAGGTPEVAATLRTEGGRRVYVASTTIEVRGEIQRPYAFSVSGRSSLGYTYFDQPIHFVREILDAVRRAPF
ncbi:MAG: hypothetical protein R3A48_13750 [Polyangiales bacterium]